MADGPPTGAEDPKPKPRNARIAIVGAGPAGLATAWFLKKQGFTNVTVFERYGRVGGLCYTMNDGYRAFVAGQGWWLEDYARIGRRGRSRAPSGRGRTARSGTSASVCRATPRTPRSGTTT